MAVLMSGDVNPKGYATFTGTTTINHNQTGTEKLYVDTVFATRLRATVHLKGSLTVNSNKDQFFGVGQKGTFKADAGTKVYFRGTCYKWPTAFTKFYDVGNSVGEDDVFELPTDVGAVPCN